MLILRGRIATLQITIQRFRQFVERIESRAPANRFKRFPFILGCAALYLGMVAPLVLTARYEAAASDAALGICKACLGAAACGGLIEAIGDAQKSFYKSLSRDPTVRWVDQGLFSVVRHPNYTGEQLLWVGSFGAGVACAAPSIMSCWGWMVGAVLGLLGIQFVLVQATTGLERRQQEAYGGSPEFQAYKGRTWGGFTFPAKKAEADSAQKQF